jgi:hypothetical protein
MRKVPGSRVTGHGNHTDGPAEMTVADPSEDRDLLLAREVGKDGLETGVRLDGADRVAIVVEPGIPEDLTLGVNEDRKPATLGHDVGLERDDLSERLVGESGALRRLRFARSPDPPPSRHPRQRPRSACGRCGSLRREPQRAAQRSSGARPRRGDRRLAYTRGSAGLAGRPPQRRRSEIQRLLLRLDAKARLRSCGPRAALLLIVHCASRNGAELAPPALTAISRSRLTVWRRGKSLPAIQLGTTATSSSTSV